MSFIYKYETYTLTPFVKPPNILNLATQNKFYIKLYVESTFTIQGRPKKGTAGAALIGLERAISSLFIFAISVTRLGDLLDFGQLFKAFGSN